MTPSRLDHLLDRAAGSSPDASAVEAGAATVSYRELHSTAVGLSRVLSAAGIAPGERVAVLAPKSALAVGAIYGTFKAGACCVPLDPRAPAARLATILGDCGAAAVLATGATMPLARDVLARSPSVRAGVLLDVEDPPAADPRWRSVGTAPLWDMAGGASRHTTPAGGGADDLAYLLYTSGSTGRPKGVMLSHRNVMAFVDWATGEFSLTAGDRVASHAPFHFDLSTFDVLGAAATGATLVLVPRRALVFPRLLAQWFRESAATVWYSVPSAWTGVLERGGLQPGDLDSLRVILFAGEVFPPRYLRRLRELAPRARLCNLFGPTETNVCTWYEVGDVHEAGAEDLPIGTPISGVRCEVCAEGGSPVPSGAVGELIVTGPTVMQGYWGDAAATESVRTVGPDGTAAYRTGDLAWRDENGLLHFAGRADNQVKSRGYRIELGDLEATLRAHPAVLDAVAVALPDEAITNRLAAAVVSAAGSQVASGEVLQWCRQHLPAYLVPDHVEVLPALPRTSTGKADRRAVRALFA